MVLVVVVIFLFLILFKILLLLLYHLDSILYNISQVQELQDKVFLVQVQVLEYIYFLKYLEINQQLPYLLLLFLMYHQSTNLYLKILTIINFLLLRYFSIIYLTFHCIKVNNYHRNFIAQGLLHNFVKVTMKAYLIRSIQVIQEQYLDHIKASNYFDLHYCKPT